MKLGEFIDHYKEAIARRVVESYPPLYRPSEDQRPLPRLLRKPLGGQVDAIRGAALSWRPTRAPPSSARWARARPSSARQRPTWPDSGGR